MYDRSRSTVAAFDLLVDWPEFGVYSMGGLNDVMIG